MFRILVVGTSNFIFNQPNLSGNSVLHERTKKMGMHHVTLQGTETRQTRDMFNVQFLDTAPHASFMFRYRPKALLAAQGIVPNTTGGEASRRSCNPGAANDTPSAPQQRKRKRQRGIASGPSIPGTKDSDDDSTEQEIRDTRQKMLNMQARLEALQQRKREPAEGQVKYEAVASLHADANINGIIDLTDD